MVCRPTDASCGRAPRLPGHSGPCGMMSARKEKNHGRELAMAESFDLGGYLECIGYEAEAAPTWETLAELHRRHVMTFPFENINPLMGWPVPLDIGELQAKFVAGGRGGYCFEQNLLFQAALEAIGYKVRSEERRVGKEGMARCMWYRQKGKV